MVLFVKQHPNAPQLLLRRLQRTAAASLAAAGVLLLQDFDDVGLLTPSGAWLSC
jgi:hypothetical protein